MRACVSAAAGFLLAVLWFDLMFDVQVRRGGADAVDSIARYYRRVTTDARPMNRLVALVMLATFASLVAELIDDRVPQWVAITSLALAVVAIGTAATRTVPRAVHLGTQADAAADQVAAARMILREHVFCAGCIATVLALQLIAG